MPVKVSLTPIVMALTLPHCILLHVQQDNSLLADALSNLTTGIQVFAEATTKVAVTARDSIQSNVIDPTREKVCTYPTPHR